MNRLVTITLVVLAGLSLVHCGQLGGLLRESPSPPAATSASPASASPSPGVEYDEALASGGASPKNIVQVKNNQDGKTRIAARIQLNTIKGDTAAPVNIAFAQASCVDCRTMAVALQLNVRNSTAHDVRPANVAFALNAVCTNCITIARALQYNIPVEDPTQISSEVRQLVLEMRRELTDISSSNSIDIRVAEQRVNAVIDRFRALALSLNDQRDEKIEANSPSPSPGLIPSASPSEAPSGSGAPPPTASPTATP